MPPEENVPVTEEFSQDSLSNINPAWNDLLNDIPQELHSKITPHLTKWDSGVQQRFQQVHSDYEPYKVFRESGIDPDHLKAGYGLLQTVYERPLEVVRALREAFPNIDFSSIFVDQGELDTETEVKANPYHNLPPELVQQIQNQQNQVNTMAQLLLKQREEQLAREEEVKLDTAMKNLRIQYGDFDEQTVLQLALSMNNDVEAAVKHYQSVINNALAARQRPVAPTLLGSGGAIPEKAVDPRKLNPKETQSLVADILKASIANRG